jgi:hypothetical protein
MPPPHGAPAPPPSRAPQRGALWRLRALKKRALVGGGPRLALCLRCVAHYATRSGALPLVGYGRGGPCAGRFGAARHRPPVPRGRGGHSPRRFATPARVPLRVRGVPGCKRGGGGPLVQRLRLQKLGAPVCLARPAGHRRAKTSPPPHRPSPRHSRLSRAPQGSVRPMLREHVLHSPLDTRVCPQRSVGLGLAFAQQRRQVTGAGTPRRSVGGRFATPKSRPTRGEHDVCIMPAVVP